jgi:7-cyano-7-deazaguanine reductase
MVRALTVSQAMGWSDSQAGAAALSSHLLCLCKSINSEKICEAMKKKRSKHRTKKPSAEGVTFPFDKPDKIKTDFLKTLPYKGLEQLVEYSSPEFSAACPYSGLPDIATVIIEYIPDKKIVELKSLKYYFVSYRNVGIYQEDATNRIFGDLFALLKPKYMKVTTIYNTRGGIDSTCTIEKVKSKS